MAKGVLEVSYALDTTARATESPRLVSHTWARMLPPWDQEPGSLLLHETAGLSFLALALKLHAQGLALIFWVEVL